MSLSGLSLSGLSLSGLSFSGLSAVPLPTFFLVESFATTVAMNKTCKLCTSQFIVDTADLAFLEKVSPVFNEVTYSLPPPSLCPMCRQQRRLAFRNERQLYKRNCDSSGKAMITNTAPDKPYVVYSTEEYWSDARKPLDYGREFDFSRPFFPQYRELQSVAPYLALCVSPDAAEFNCRYVNFAGMNKNCHMIFDSDSNEDCYNSNVIKHSQQCGDCAYVDSSELCFQCIDCKDCYDLKYSQDCSGCNSSAFLKNCIGCNDCFFCSNLTRKRYHIRNKPYSPEEYRAQVAKFDLGNLQTVEALEKKFEEFKLSYSQKATHSIKTENCLGDYLHSSKNCYHCFNVVDGEDLRYCDSVYHGVKDCMDVCSFGEHIEQVYESGTVGVNSFHILFCFGVVGGNESLLYSEECRESKNCFGSIGLTHDEYCILNKQYSKDDYTALVPKIIEHMRETEEWGEFFPPEISRFDYNETIAQDHYPLTEEVACALGFTWRAKDKRDYQPQQVQIPASIVDVGEDICEQLLACRNCRKNYKVSKPEFSFYVKQGIPIPVECLDCRHRARLDKRNPMNLWTRECAECGVAVSSSYAPSRPEKILCEPCYQESIA